MTLEARHVGDNLVNGLRSSAAATLGGRDCDVVGAALAGRFVVFHGAAALAVIVSASLRSMSSRGIRHWPPIRTDGTSPERTNS